MSTVPGWVRSPRLVGAAAAVVLAVSVAVAVAVPERLERGRDAVGRVVGGEEILRGPDLLLVEVPDATGRVELLRLRVDDLLPAGTEVSLRITPDGDARLRGPDARRNPPSGPRPVALVVGVGAALVLASAMLCMAAQRHERAAG